MDCILIHLTVCTVPLIIYGGSDKKNIHTERSYRSWSALFTKANVIAAGKLKIKLEDIAIVL